MKCPNCGHEIETQQRRAAESRWAGMTAAQRAAEMSRVRKLGVRYFESQKSFAKHIAKAGGDQ